MQPVKPKMKKVILTGIVACMSFIGFSSAAPVSAPRPAVAEAVPLPSSPVPSPSPRPGPNSPSSSSRQASRPSGVSRGDSRVAPPGHAGANPGAPPPPPPRPSSFGLSLGQIDYAAAGIARRVSRIFVKRMSAQQEQEHRDTQDKGKSTPDKDKDAVEDADNPEQHEAARLPPTSGAPSSTIAHRQDPAYPEIRACRWGCF